jgi:hypothetical protein
MAAYPLLPNSAGSNGTAQLASCWFLLICEVTLRRTSEVNLRWAASTETKKSHTFTFSLSSGLISPSSSHPLRVYSLFSGLISLPTSHPLQPLQLLQPLHFGILQTLQTQLLQPHQSLWPLSTFQLHRPLQLLRPLQPLECGASLPLGCSLLHGWPQEKGRIDFQWR